MLERATVPGGTRTFVTSETIVVGATRFHVVAEGDRAGWSIADGPGVTVTVPEDRDPT